MTRPSDDELERVAKDCTTAAQVMRETGTFETGQSILDEAAAMLRACKGRVRVKPLEWTAYGVACWISPAPLFGSFRVEHYGNEKWQALWSVPGYCSAFVEGEFSTAEDAKAAIESRILAALEPAPDHATWNAAIEAAAKVARDCVYHDSAGTGFDESAFDAVIRAIKKGPDHD